MHGLDLSFMKKNPLPDEMKHRPTRERNTKRSKAVPMPMYVPDIQEFVSVVGEEPTKISSRKHLRDHERAYNMIQVGDDIKPGEIAKKNEAKKAERDRIAAGIDAGWR